jgi:hypothetical protein
MNDFIGGLPGRPQYLGAIGMQMASRPKQGRKGKFCEPIWVWRRIS